MAARVRWYNSQETSNPVVTHADQQGNRDDDLAQMRQEFLSRYNAAKAGGQDMAGWPDPQAIGQMDLGGLRTLDQQMGQRYGNSWQSVGGGGGSAEQRQRDLEMTPSAAVQQLENPGQSATVPTTPVSGSQGTIPGFASPVNGSPVQFGSGVTENVRMTPHGAEAFDPTANEGHGKWVATTLSGDQAMQARTGQSGQNWATMTPFERGNYLRGQAGLPQLSMEQFAQGGGKLTPDQQAQINGQKQAVAAQATTTSPLTDEGRAKVMGAALDPGLPKFAQNALANSGTMTEPAPNPTPMAGVTEAQTNMATTPPLPRAAMVDAAIAGANKQAADAAQATEAAKAAADPAYQIGQTVGGATKGLLGGVGQIAHNVGVAFHNLVTPITGAPHEDYQENPNADKLPEVAGGDVPMGGLGFPSNFGPKTDTPTGGTPASTIAAGTAPAPSPSPSSAIPSFPAQKTGTTGSAMPGTGQGGSAAGQAAPGTPTIGKPPSQTGMNDEAPNAKTLMGSASS